MGRGRHWREVEKVAKDYKDGKSLSELGKEYGKAKNTIKRVVESTGTRMRGRGGNNHEKK